MKLIINFTNLQTAAGLVQNDVHVFVHVFAAKRQTKTCIYYNPALCPCFEAFSHVQKPGYEQFPAFCPCFEAFSHGQKTVHRIFRAAPDYHALFQPVMPFSGTAPVYTNPAYVEVYPFHFCENDTLTIH